MPDELDNVDIAAIAKDIGSELFGAGEAEGVNSPASDLAPPDAGTALDTAAENSPAPNSGERSEAGEASGDETPAVEIEPLPKSWKKEMEGDWKALPPSVRQYVQKREEDAYRGIKQYAAGHQGYEAITQPFKEIFSQHPDVQPVQLFQNLMHSHVKLLTLPPAEKAEFAKQLLSAYGIDSAAQAQQENQNLPPGYAQMQAELAETRRIIRNNQAQAHAAEVARYEAEIAAFAKANPLFPDVQDDILRLISTGAAVDVKSAYETAVWANPATRAKLIAEQQASAHVKTPAKKPMTNIESSGAAKISRKPASIDDTVNSVLAKHYSTH